MKNIHIIPTEKPSRLFTYKDESYLYYIKKDIDSKSKNENCQNQNIFITNDEKIKDKDYVLSDASIGALYLDGVMNTDSMLAEGQWKKIILTTDVDLIKDGVQEIDDTFLEWFVKNPSCEFVDIKKGYKNPNSKSFLSEVYKIYVPTEKFKQEALNHFLSTSSVIVKDPQISNFNKQETLEEAAERLYPTDYGIKSKDILCIIKQDVFIAGARWQQERSYSEEDLEVAFFEGQFGRYSFNDWFEQFKKK